MNKLKGRWGVKRQETVYRLIPKNLLPGRDSKEWEDYDSAEKIYDKARKLYTKAGETYVKAGEAYIKKWSKELEALHSQLYPDCPWDGHIFFERRSTMNEVARPTLREQLEVLEDEWWAKRRALLEKWEVKCQPIDDEYRTKRIALIEERWAKLKALIEEWEARKEEHGEHNDHRR